MLHHRRPRVFPGRSRVECGISLCAAAAALVAVFLPSAGHALIAACADGSVIFAKKWEDVRCAGAAEVAPQDVPQLGFVPRDAAKQRQTLRRELEAMREGDLEAQLAALPAVGAPPGASGLPLVALGAAEQRDLARLIAVGRERAAASIERAAPHGRIRLAHSRAFEARLRAGLGARGSSAPGPVLLFSLEPGAAGLGATPPCFAQGGVTFRPHPMDSGQLGWIAVAAGAPERGAPRLGYVVLPAGFDLARPLVVFWGDAVAAAWLRR